MKQIKIDDYITKSLTDYGREVNTNRQLASLDDGLKIVYRRTINSAMKFAGKGLVKTATIVGDVIGTTHPHGDASVADVVSSLVRWNIFKGQGNHGVKLIYGDDASPSSSRYTEAAINDVWHDILKDLLPYVPYKEAEIPGNSEPEYMPTPIPMILLFSGIGIAYGANARYPMFTAESLYDAMVNNDPMCLKAPFGLHIDYAHSELEQLWTTGLGKIVYSFDVQKTGISSGYGTMISGSAEMFKPNLEKAFEEEIAKGQVYLLDQTSDSNGQYSKAFVGKSANVRAITLDDIQAVCESVCTYSRVFRLTVTDGKSTFIIPLYDWLKHCYYNYLDLLKGYIKDQINKLNFSYRVFYWLPKVSQTLIDHRDFDENQIVSFINDKDCDLEVIKAILRKSISTLKKADSTDKLKEIQEQIKYYENIDVGKYTEDLIMKM